MDCPKCKTPGAYQGFNYREGVVDCLNRTCTFYSEKHAEKTAADTPPSDPFQVDHEALRKLRAEGWTPAVLNPTTHYVSSKVPRTAEEEEWDKLWNEVFDKALRLHRGENLAVSTEYFGLQQRMFFATYKLFLEAIRFTQGRRLVVRTDGITLESDGNRYSYWSPTLAAAHPPEYREHYFTRSLIRAWKAFK